MKTKLFYAGTISMGIAAALALLDLTVIKTSFSDTIMQISISTPRRSSRYWDCF